MDTTTPLMHTISGALSRVPLGRSKFYEEIAAGHINTVKVGRRTYVTEAELRRYVDSLAGSVGVA